MLFVSCASVSYPDWYLQHTKDTIYLYGIGEGKSVQSAKLEALNDLASQISINVESHLKIRKEQTNTDDINSFHSNVVSEIGTNISDIELDSLEYPFIEERNGVFFVQARIQKAKIIDKLNSDIESYTIKVNEILSDMKNTKCATLSPKHKNKLAYFYDMMNYKIQQIYSLDGRVEQEKLANHLKSILQTTPKAYYISFANGGRSADYQAVDNALLSEYSKFFQIDSKNLEIFYIENQYKINRTKDTISLSVSIKDCNNNTIFDISLESKDSNITNATNRLKVQLYKKLHSWQEASFME